MNSNEFLVEDYCRHAWTDFLTDIYSSAAFQMVAEGKDDFGIKHFSTINSLPPIIGQKYIICTILWQTENGIGFISFAKSDDHYELVGIEDSGHLLVKNLTTGKLRKFPEIGGPSETVPMSSVLFNDTLARDKFEILFNIKYGQFKIMGKPL